MSAPFLETKKFLVGRVEEQLIPSVASGTAVVPLGTISAPMSVGSGLEVDITASVADVLTAAVVHTGAGGTGYAVGDYILVEGGGTNGVLKVTTIGTNGVVTGLSIVNVGVNYTTQTAVATDPFPAFMQSVIEPAPGIMNTTITPQMFVMRDLVSSEQLSIEGVQAIAGVYSVNIGTPGNPSSPVNSYSAPYASILTPGVKQTIANSDFNCRLRAITMAPAIAPDGESEKFATGDHRRDFSIMGVRSGTIGFQDKIAVQKSTGSGCEVNMIASAGKITSLLLTPAAAGTGYVPGDLLSVTGGGGTGAVIQVNTVNAQTGAVTAFSSTIINGGSGYTTNATAATSLLQQQTPQWAKFLRGMGHIAKTYSTVGLGLQNIAAGDRVTMTLGVCYVQGGGSPNGQMFTFAGCSGDGQLGADGLGKPWTIKGSFTGKFIGNQDLTPSQILTLSGMETAMPEKLLSNSVNTTDNVSATIVSMRVSKFEYAFGNKVSSVDNQSDPTGYDYFMIKEREPKITFDPYLKPISEEDVIGIVENENSFDILIKSALSTPNITIEAPRCQLMNPTFGAKDGVVDTSRTYRLLGNNLGGGAVQSAIPDECSCEILLWSRA